MKREIIVGILSSLLGALIAFLVASAMGILERTLTDIQLRETANNLSNSHAFRDILVQKMKESGQFIGPKGGPGPKGDEGPDVFSGLGLKLCSAVAYDKVQNKTIFIDTIPVSHAWTQNDCIRYVKEQRHLEYFILGCAFSDGGSTGPSASLGDRINVLVPPRNCGW